MTNRATKLYLCTWLVKDTKTLLPQQFLGFFIQQWLHLASSISRILRIVWIASQKQQAVFHHSASHSVALGILGLSSFDLPQRQRCGLLHIDHLGSEKRARNVCGIWSYDSTSEWQYFRSYLLTCSLSLFKATILKSLPTINRVHTLEICHLCILHTFSICEISTYQHFKKFPIVKVMYT